MPNRVLTLEELAAIVFDGKPYRLSSEQKKRVNASFDFLKSFSVNKVIYGINTGFGPMAQYKISETDLSRLQSNLVRSHASGTGDPLAETETRAVMTCRLHSLALGYSGVSPAVTDQLEKFLEQELYPVIFSHGGVGASGDLVQLSHLALGLIGEGDAFHQGQRQPVSKILKKLKLSPLQLSLRDGLAIINGTSCMTGLAALNVLASEKLLHWAVAASCLINEIIAAFDDAFSEALNKSKQHPGQRNVAALMREHLEDSRLINKRESWFFTDTEESGRQVFRKKLQEYYSIRCIPQILGPVWDAVEAARQLTQNEINSASDNPIVDMENKNVYHGGNFHGDYIAYEMDKLKMGVTKMTMLAERQLNYLLNSRLNDQFPPFLNRQAPGLNFGMQGIQFTATSTTAENQTLSNPMYVHSIPNNNDNQDVVSMGANSAMLASKVIRNAGDVIAILLMALAEATDISGSQERLSSRSKKLYKTIRKICQPITSDQPHYEDIQNMSEFLKNYHP